jgi:hypothetical protein
VRFYFFDGTSAKGPYSAEEVAALPGFDAESVVCPVGSEKREDWKPAIAYEPLKNLLFKPLPLPTLAPPRAPTLACPKCAHRNEQEAVFCNRCGSRMSEEPAAPAFQEPTASPAPAMVEPPVAVSPPVMAEPQYPRLALPVLPPLPIERPWKTYIAAGAAVLAAFYIFFVWLPKRKPAPQKAAPSAAKAAAPPAAPAPAATPAMAVAPAAPTPTAPKPAAAPVARQPSEQRRRRAEALPQPKQKPQAPVPTPVLQKLAPEPADATPKPQAQEAAPPPRAAEGILLPGMPSKIQRPPSPPSADAEKLSLDNAREQFDFCHQLMRQQAHGDVFDTCLCPNARKAAPFNGSKDLYIRLAQEASKTNAEKPQPFFEIVSAKLQDANTAVIAALRKSGKKDKGQETTETWLLEDGLWCLQP